VNSFIKATRGLARRAGRPNLAFSPHWIDRLLVATGRTVTWRDIMSHPHGYVFAERQFGNLRKALRTKDKKIHAAPPEFLGRTRKLLNAPRESAPAGYPFLLGNRRNRHAMNSWLNELPSLHRSGKRNEAVIHPEDAAQLGIAAGDLVRVNSPVGSIELPASVCDEPRRGMVLVDHGWGSRIFDPCGGAAPLSYGANRNRLIDAAKLDPLSQTPAFSSSYVNVSKVR
jgi:formate dehydrogenase